MSRFRIVTRGEVSLGFNQPEVAGGLRQLCKYDADKLQQVFSGLPFTFKSGLDEATARRYKAALDKTGIVCEIEDDLAEEKIELATDQPFAISHHPAVDQLEEGMICPKCGEQQPQGHTCSTCGLVIAKFNQRQQATRYPQYAEPAAVPYDDDESTSGAWLGTLMKLVAICVLCVGGYFGYTAIFAESREVIVYRFEDCEPCDAAIEFLEGEGIACTVYDIEESNDRTIEFVHKSKKRNIVPLIFVGSVRIDGYNQAMLQVAAAKYNGTLKGDGSAEVVMYCRDSCGYCKRAARFFKEREIPYTELDIDRPSNLTAYRNLGGAGTPLIMIGDAVRIDGFDRSALELVLNETGLM